MLFNKDDLASYQSLSSRLLPHWNKLISGSPNLRPEEKGEWHNVLHNSDSKCAAMALLLILLPNIRHLNSKRPWNPTGPARILTIAERIVASNESMALSKVQRVTIDFGGGGNENIQAFAIFAILPSMRWLDGIAVRGVQNWDNRSSFE